MTFMSSSIQFFDCRLSLIHIPLHLYSHFTHALLSLIIPAKAASDHAFSGFGAEFNGYGYSYYSNGDDSPDFGLGDSDRCREFLNVSVTPVECSVVCGRRLVDQLFRPILESLDEAARAEVSIAEDDYVVIQVDGEGMEAGRRVLDLTSPLSMAGISIFFISTYFSDYILVPAKSSTKVTKALQKRGFVFEKHSDAFVTHRRTSSTPSLNAQPPPTPPPIASFEDLQKQTFNTLRANNIEPQVNLNTKLVLCGARRAPGKRRNGRSDDQRFYLGIVKVLLRQPEFFSLTITDKEAESLLIQESLLHLFKSGHDDRDGGVLLGVKDAEILIPVVLDFRELPLESTGIVCGIAARLAGNDISGSLPGDEPVEMSYLSTARTGTVMVQEENIERAVASLKY